MKLIEALDILKGMNRRKGNALRCFLASGINPLHLMTFLSAELSLLFPDQTIEVSGGFYGDLLGNINRVAKSDAVIGVVVIEWSDLDSRLGLRSTARWIASETADILSSAKVRVSRIQQAIEKASERLPIVVSLPTLPLPPISFVPGWQAGSLELGLRATVELLTTKISSCGRVRVLSSQWIDSVSPPRERLDVENEVLTGFPYKLPHASSLAHGLSRMTQLPVPKKGLITDLDDTLWRGIVGEDGVGGISWDLDHHGQMHAFYQRFLGALASEGVLIGVASKNELSIVEAALGREDLALSPGVLFPVEANWGPKSQSVSRILETWNVGPDSVVFIDDSRLELAEVKASHPEMECLLFPTNDSAAVYDLTLRLRNLFGKSAILEEDSIRLESLRGSHVRATTHDAGTARLSGFIEDRRAEIGFNFSKTPLDARALELVNKTNQFNLNGRRHTEASWSNYLLDPTTVLSVVSYRDKFGPLGKIAVIGGTLKERKMTVNTWVMSCRAFSRQIEQRCLAELFAKFDLDEVEFEYLRTERNGPLREFLGEIADLDASLGCILYREQLDTLSRISPKA